MVRRYLFTSESVTEGHPDKVCDQVSDSILDEFLAADPNARVAVEAMTTKGMVLVAGEVSSNAGVDLQKVIRKTIGEIGYDSAAITIKTMLCSVISNFTNLFPNDLLQIYSSI